MCWCVIPEDSMLPLRGTTWQISCRLRIQYASGRPFTHNPSSMLIHGLVFTPALLRSLLTGKVSLHWCPMRNSLKKRDMLHSLWRTTLARYLVRQFLSTMETSAEVLLPPIAGHSHVANTCRLLRQVTFFPQT